MFVFVSALFRFYLVFDVGAAHFWEFVGFLLAFLRFYWVCAGGAAHSWELFGNQLVVPCMCLAHFRELFRFLWELARFLWG